MPNVTLYLGGGTGFDQNWVDASPAGRTSIEQQIAATASQLAGLPWNVYILSFLHVHARTGPTELFYNGTPVGKLFPGLNQQLSRLRASGKRLLISIGGWDNACDFDGIQKAGVSAFLAQARQQVIAPLGLDGIDLDLEPTSDDPGIYCPPDPDWYSVYQRLSPVLVELSNQAAAAGLVVSHAPAVYIPQFYTQSGGILEGTRRPSGSNSISFLNYQTYGDGTGVAGSVEAFAAQIDPRSTGIANPAAFVSAGFGIADGLRDDPEVARQNIVALRQKFGQINGAFVWRYTTDPAQMATWAKTLSGAVGQGLDAGAS